MAKCIRCGKAGLFLKVNSDGICIDCERVLKLKAEEDYLNSKISIAQNEYGILQESYNTLLKDKDSIYAEISEKAKNEAIVGIADKIELMNIELKKVTAKAEEEDALVGKASNELEQMQKSISLSANKLHRLQMLFKSMQYSTKRYFDEESFSKEILSDNISNEADELLSTTIKLKLHLMDIRELRKLYIQNRKVIKDLLLKYLDRYTTKANIAIYKLMVIALEAELQNALYNLSYSKLDKSIKDIKAITAKYQKIATDGNQNIAPTITKFIGEIEYLYIEGIKIEYEYYIQKERIKEEQKAIREQMRQEAVERKILEEERKKIEQEESKYKNEITYINEQISMTQDQIKIKQLEDRIVKLQSQLGDVAKKKEDITKLQNGKAGYIYIISNLGSFGDKTFKIGMTRRINPQDRIDELGGASLPFNFDVHSFIFSNDAPTLEYNLHKQLNDKRVNKVNLRKEFFNTSIDELEDLVYSLEPSAEFNRTMIAEQYFQSMAVENVPESVTIIDDEGIEEDEDEQ